MEAAACYWLDKMNVKLLPVTDEAGPLRDRLVELSAYSGTLARCSASGRTPAVIEANERCRPRSKRCTSQFDQMEADSVLHGIADAPNPCAEFLNADVYRRRAVLGAIMDVTLLRNSRGCDPTSAAKAADSSARQW